ncbi:MAG: glycosyltransferase family 1 protein [Hespellia sp.]|nr:glycosyltransferase family 1 protein [Hespellia sp.]
MNILFYALTKNQGGIENLIYNYYSWMKRTNLQITFLAMDENVVYEEEFRKLGAKVIHLPEKKKNRQFFYEKMEAIVRSGKYDAVWFNDNNLCDISLLKIARKRKVPVRICHSHNSTLTTPGKLRLLRHRWNSLFITKYATDLWSCSDKAAEWAYGKDWKQKDVRMIPNAVDTMKFCYNNEIRSAMRKQMHLEGKFVIGNVGRFCEAKNHEFILHIFKRLLEMEPNGELILIGQGELFEQTKKKAKELQVEQSVRFLGQQDNVAEIIQCFDAFLMPSLYEGFPVAIVEAQAAGVPCVISDVITSEVNITGSVHYLSLQEDTTKWSQVLLNTRNDIDRIQRSNKMQESNYSIRNAAKALENWFLDRREE